MLPQKHRVTTEEFTGVLNKGMRAFGNNFTLSWVNNKANFKASVVISKKVSKKAVDRNLQKRRTREAIKKIFTNSNFSNYPYSCVFFIKKNINDVPFPDLVKEIDHLSRNLK